MSKLNQLELERLRYWQGQTLRSVDFRDQLAIDAQLRWWHNRALHNTFGIAKGFEVEQINQNHSVKIHRGLAYDCFGRELIHAVDACLPLLTEGDVTLLVRFKEDKYRATCEGEVGSVYSSDKIAGADQIEFFWKPTDSVDVQDGVPLARLRKKEILGSKRSLLRPLARSRPLARPRMASGATIPGNTAWEIWDKPEVRTNAGLLGVQVTIDTSAAGFTEVPCYFAWLQRQPVDSSKPAFFVYSEHVDKSSMNSFTFRLLFPSLSSELQGRLFAVNRGNEPQVLKLIQEHFSVCWLGIQAGSAQKFLETEVNHGNF
ncbi:hypothetical protein Noc_1863 [Nitrosococcus oceani ATCC 19707]|uniref:Uncharacterized protein n=2 Tax=Nitrosococcus oceani TaxID=1229 RepID=Q3JA17_NITOC|nr:hypothetical protein [Nitrosococcus oceani]ABA58329.1 hypothetical protein Noc_1863 [Nitrosococcus oceani ATCC 19707]KFI19259.1 hypothetical protein IB75_09925 [Nitrosococcus oceani C-27]GEM18718.1 hypothetical protein NONS58_00750 [Nitrosococcus oceani]